MNAASLTSIPEIFRFVPRQPETFRLVGQIGNSDVVPSYPDAIGAAPRILAKGVFPNLGIPAGTNYLGNSRLVAARRARLVAGLGPWADARPQYRLRLGPVALPFSCLSDEALADLRSRIAGDVRRERSRRRG